MNHPSIYRVIGLMSGTSLDGLDMAYVHFELQDGKWQFEIQKTRHLPYGPEWKQRLQQSIHLSALDLLALNVFYGQWLGAQLKAFIEHEQLEVDFVASHGHTVFHQPQQAYTYQIGYGQAIANGCGQTVVCDFRSLDVLLGGQGAPLVPIGDQELFGDYDFCLNLGGISNVSFSHQGKRVAFDIGPANMLLNYIVEQLGLTYDRGGAIAASGSCKTPLLDKLNQLPYYQLPFPKSLGYEWFLEQILPLFEHLELEIKDQLATAVEHVAYQIAAAVLAQTGERRAKLFITGGGAKNDYLIERLRDRLGERVEVYIPEELLVDYKEAVVFALMGIKRMRGEVNCLASVTGAERDCSGGVIYQAG